MCFVEYDNGAVYEWIDTAVGRLANPTAAAGIAAALAPGVALNKRGRNAGRGNDGRVLGRGGGGGRGRSDASASRPNKKQKQHNIHRRKQQNSAPAKEEPRKVTWVHTDHTKTTATGAVTRTTTTSPVGFVVQNQQHLQQQQQQYSNTKPGSTARSNVLASSNTKPSSSDFDPPNIPRTIRLARSNVDRTEDDDMAAYGNNGTFDSHAIDPSVPGTTLSDSNRTGAVPPVQPITRVCLVRHEGMLKRSRSLPRIVLLLSIHRFVCVARPVRILHSLRIVLSLRPPATP